MLTPAEKFLQDHKIPFKKYEYECTVDHDYGKFSANALNMDPKMIFKSIVLVYEKTYITAVTPVDAMISLKNAARILKLKSLEVAKPQDAQRITGYVIGGLSPFGQKRQTKILLCESALQFDEILVSGGRRGYSVGVNPNDLISATNATVGDFIEHKS
ncbi:MAG: aminoacyl-tRNA deacylase [Succinivibrio sp.]|nr:aminoacyl-tRNA deacylase [Succinivibrio sp.]